jgi:type IV fimbrial biogenesis protein FimT
MGKRSKQRGFTLGETLATLAVAGIGLSLAVPGLQSVAEGNRRAIAVNQLVATMHLARGEAVMRNRHVTVCASDDGESCADRPWEYGWIAYLDEDADGQRDPDETIIDQVGGLPGLELGSDEFDRGLSYRPDGRAAGDSADTSGGEFAFCEPGAESAIRVLILRTNGTPVLSDRGRDGQPVTCPTP